MNQSEELIPKWKPETVATILVIKLSARDPFGLFAILVEMNNGVFKFTPFDSY